MLVNDEKVGVKPLPYQGPGAKREVVETKKECELAPLPPKCEIKPIKVNFGHGEVEWYNVSMNLSMGEIVALYDMLKIAGARTLQSKAVMEYVHAALARIGIRF